jgi:SAM-dependent methyltransferase
MLDHNERIVDQFTRQAVPFSAASPAAEMLELLVGAAGTGPEDVVLDVACGPGLVACAFARVARHVTGIDVTPAMLDRAREIAAERRIENATFQLGEAVPLPFDDACFSIVVSRFAFHHFLDPGAALAEMKRVCRPGGRVVVADLLASPDPVKAATHHRMEILRDPSHVRSLPLTELRHLFAQAGLDSPAETPWRFDVEVEALLARSFPAPGDDAVIRKAFADSIADDAMGLATRMVDGRIWFTFSSVVLTGRV